MDRSKEKKHGSDDTVRTTPGISIVAPLYNEEESVHHLYEAIREVMEKTDSSYEIIFVDDGSKDQTFQKAKELYQQDSHLRVVKFRRNYGQTPAMQAGFDHAKGEIIISMDGDLQNDPKDIPKFIEKMEEGYSIVCGWRKNRQDEPLRKFLSRVANRLICLITGIEIHDNGCSLKAYRREVLERTYLYSEMHRFIPAMISIGGIKYSEIVVNHHARQFGHSKYGFARVWKVFLDLFLIKMLVGFSSRSALWFGILSLPAFLLGATSMLVAVMSYLGNISFSLVLPIISLLSFFLFAHLLLMGMLSEIILKTGMRTNMNTEYKELFIAN